MGIFAREVAPPVKRGPAVSPRPEGWYFWKKGWQAGCGHLCCWLFLIWCMAFPILVAATIWMPPQWMQPGNEVRKDLHTKVTAALTSNSWTAVKKAYKEDVFKNRYSAFMIGDSSGLKYWQEEGLKTKDRWPMGSQTKMMTAIAIYRVMQKVNCLPESSTSCVGDEFEPNTYVKDLLPGWPKNGPGGRVQMKHLLSMTTGFMADYFKPGCVKNLVPQYKRDWTEQEAEDHMTWEKCMNQIALSEFRYEPGSVFNYGPWHLFVAGGIALKAMGLPLTKYSWEQLVMTEVYKPAGVWTTPQFPKAPQLPDLSTGMSVSGDEWNAIIHKLMYGNLLDPYHRATYMQDHTQNVVQIANNMRNSTGQPYRDMRTSQTLQGSWHYAQGHWIACDVLTNKAAVKRYEDGKPALMWAEENTACGFSSSSMNPGYNGLHHSSGEPGSFIWMDLHHQYYGIYIQWWDVWWVLFNGVIGLIMGSCCCCGLSCCIAVQVNYVKMKDSVLKE